MSRKDPRRAIALCLPDEVWREVQRHRRRGPRKRLMDTVRVLVERALRLPPVAPPALVVPPDAGGPCRALQLPPKARQQVQGLGADWNMAPDQVVAVLVMRGLDSVPSQGVCHGGETASV